MKIPAFSSLSLRPAQRAAESGVVPGTNGVRSQATSVPGAVRSGGMALISGSSWTEGNFRRTRFGAEPWPLAKKQGGIAVAIVFQTGRRLMRQTVLPTKTREVSAAARNDSSARRVPSRSSGSARRPGLRFGLPLTPESGGPSRPPTAQQTLSAPRARRRQEFKNAQQNVDRRHPPGRDPGRCGPRQSSRRV